MAIRVTTSVSAGVFSITSDQYCSLSNCTVGFPGADVEVGQDTKQKK